MGAFIAGAVLGATAATVLYGAIALRRSGDIGRTLLAAGRWVVDVDPSGDIVCAVQDRSAS